MDELEHPLIGASTNSRAAYSEDEVLQKVLEGSKNDDDGSQYATTHDNKDRIFTQHKCLKCKETSKCPSDFKYVSRKNTLEEHLSSLHGIADSYSIGSTCSSTTSHIRAITLTVVGQLRVKASQLSMICSDTKGAFTGLV